MEHIMEAANGVWQSNSDSTLRDMTPQQFYSQIDGFGLSTEDAEDAWSVFAEKQYVVFFHREA